MSFQAITWAFNQPVTSCTAKFLLVCLANYANEGFKAYPSIKTLSDLTGMNRKTVILGLDKLQNAKFISDTGQRVGETRQVKVYQLNAASPGKEQRQSHYVYRLLNRNTQEFYFGVHSSFNPESDHYYGSGRWPMISAEKPLKQIIQVFDTRIEAEDLERKLISENISDPLCRNKSIPAKSSKSGTVSSKSPETGTVEQSLNIRERVPIFPERVPKTGHGTYQEPVKEPKGEKKAPGKYIKEIRIQIEEAEQERQRLKDAHANVSATGTDWNNQEARMEFIELGRKIKQWRKEILSQ